MTLKHVPHREKHRQIAYKRGSVRDFGLLPMLFLERVRIAQTCMGLNWSVFFEHISRACLVHTI